jgi:hypothetical protein
MSQPTPDKPEKNEKGPKKPSAAGLKGLAALQGLTSASQAAHDLAFAVNTGLAGHAADKAFAKLDGAAVERLVSEAEAAEVDSPQAAAEFLRSKWPEPEKKRD